ncbi:MAG: PSD1 and planctomycete cytochrome C domain-containing protein [Spirosomataceae bacterium]
MNSKWILTGAVAVVLLSSFSFLGIFGHRVDFNEEVKPILNKHCMACHGGVKKAGGVSFLFEEEMYQPAKSGKVPVVAGDADESEMIRRILLPQGHEDKMPKEGPPLKEEEIEVLRKWIDQGAKWGNHWAYNRVERPKVPGIGGFWARLGLIEDDETRWAKNEIDGFVLEKLREQGLKPAPEADRAILIRRLSLDLTGLPPTDAQVQRFLKDTSPKAYENLVDTLLASSAYGERWAGMWLDLARYADTKGYERDPGRSIWRYRDWLIKAFNDDKPYDKFVEEQLAGDLLPNATDDDLIATGFHRNTMNNDEGGTQDEEFRVAAVIDRVNTTWDVFQGTSFGCVQCHSHPYDPFTNEEYYKYLAFFNNTRDEDVTSETPTLRFYKSDDSLRIKKVEDWISNQALTAQQKAKSLTDFRRFVRIMEPKVNSHDFDQHVNASLLDAKYFGIQENGSARWANVTLTGKNRLLLLINTGAENALLSLHQDSLQGKILTQFIVPTRKDTVLILPVQPDAGKHSLYWTLKSPKTPKNWVQIKWAAFQEALPGSNLPEFAEIEKLYSEILTGNVESTPIMYDGYGDLARTTHVFVRGNWTVKGAAVQADVPHVFKNRSQEAEKRDENKSKFKNRLDLARWMTSRDHPLTARVAVNRLWEQLFGTGIVETVEDFGSQGIAPTHQALLDWLAAEFMETNRWSLKKTLRQVVLSAAYRQSSDVTPEKLAKDPYNKWLSRGARVRLSAEQVRDQMLAVSGLLSRKMYGKSVMPLQPDNIWLSPYDGAKWQLSAGEERYRRALYIYWKRTAPYPSMVTFDAPSREFCQVRRIRTNTPLQALVTLNDPAYLEAAHCFSENIAARYHQPKQQIQEAYRRLTFRTISPARLKVLMNLYQKSLIEYRKDFASAKKLLANDGDATPELAALTVTANAMLNLDEVVTKE